MTRTQIFGPDFPLAKSGPMIQRLSALVCLSVLAFPQSDPYTEEAVARGVDYEVIASGTVGQGVALCDLDGDTDLDLVTVGGVDGVIGVFENDGSGVFSDHTATSGLVPIPFNSASGVVAADYDGDGLVDLYFSNANTPNRLVRNLGNFTFTDVTATALVGDFGFGAGSAWADYDGDGDLDLYLANNTKLSSPSPDKLYRNNGDGSFTIMNNLGLTNQDLAAWQAVWVDYDLDGDQDLYISNDKGLLGTPSHNYLWKNVDGSFVDVTQESQTAAYADSMGVAVGDFDQNGFPDLYCTNIGANPLFMNLDGSRFRDEASAARVTSDSTGWGALFFDYDNDATLDLFVCNFADTDRLYTSEDGWPCNNLAVPMRLTDPYLSYCVAIGDIDDDGDLDLVHSSMVDRIRIFIAHADSSKRWVKVLLSQPGKNRKAVGALVTVVAGGVRQTRAVMAGVGYKSSSPFMVHFGLDDSTVIDRMIVRWPDGKRTFYDDVDVNRTIRIGRGRGIIQETADQ